MKKFLLLTWFLVHNLLIPGGCGNSVGGANENNFEGDQPGECEDDADNDRNGLFDCDDPSCVGSPACKGTDGELPAGSDSELFDTGSDSSSQESDTTAEDTGSETGTAIGRDTESEQDSTPDIDSETDAPDTGDVKSSDVDTDSQTGEEHKDTETDPDDTGAIDTGDKDTETDSDDTGAIDTGDSDSVDEISDPDRDTSSQHNGDGLRLLFIGNSFTEYGSIPSMVGKLAESVGWAAPTVKSYTSGGASLSDHRESADCLTLVDEGEWDFVVLQGHSLEATDKAGQPEVFKEQVAWFYDRIKATSPDAMIILYETWAYHPDHSIYTSTFTNPQEMQAEIRFNYDDADNNYLPRHAAFIPPDDSIVAPVGDAWENQLAEENALRLHDDDLKHPNVSGQYLNGLVLFSVIYNDTPVGVTHLTLSDADANRLQRVASETLANRSK